MSKTPEELQAEIEALKTKNAELLKEKANEKAKREELDTRLAKLEKDAEAEREKLEAEAAKKAGDWDKREADLKAKHAAELAAVRGELEKERTARDRLVIDNALSSAIDGAGVSAELKPAVLAMLRAQNKSAVEINSDGDFVGKIGDKPVADFITDWAKSDAAKPFITNANNGGGAPGGKGGVKIDGNPYDKAKPNFTQQAALEKSNPTEAARLKAAAA
ncbi:MAG TPA: hypothetical protein PLS69_06040 [Terricaulis sp.]|nr:hypothetical protein [Terricaulis sp.]